MELLKAISIWSVPVLILLIPVYGFLKGVKVYESFTDGAQESFKIIYKILPNLLAMMIAIGIFRASGAMTLILDWMKPLIESMRLPEEVVPLMFLRPLSGSGSLSFVSNLLKEFGPDSFIGKLASTIQGSTETTFYIIAVYFGAVGIKKYRYAVTVGLLADLAGFFAAVFICKIMF